MQPLSLGDWRKLTSGQEPPSALYIYRGLPGTVATFSFTFRRTTRSFHHHEFSRVLGSPPVRPLGLFRVSRPLGNHRRSRNCRRRHRSYRFCSGSFGRGRAGGAQGSSYRKHLKRRRYGRDVDAVQDVAEDDAEDVAVKVAVAQQMDSAGCVAKLLCEIEAMSADQLTPAMASFKTAFEDNENLRSARGVYDLAISFGSKFAKKDSKACSTLFEKCVLSREDLSFMLDSTFSCQS
nr:uncharacterized protein LOC113810758 [Penaeus vannamei]